MRQRRHSTCIAVIGVQNRPVETASGSLGGVQGVEDEFGAHVIGDRPAGQPA